MGSGIGVSGLKGSSNADFDLATQPAVSLVSRAQAFSRPRIRKNVIYEVLNPDDDDQETERPDSSDAKKSTITAQVREDLNNMLRKVWICEDYEMAKYGVHHGAKSIVRMGTCFETQARRSIKYFVPGKRPKRKEKEEAAFLCLLRHHPNIVRLYEILTDGGSHSLVMELCEGGKLVDEIREWGVLNEQDTSVIMQQAFSAVRYMHRNLVAHRDLRPENLLLKSKGFLKNCEIKVIDFGSAKLCGHGETMHDKVGTPYYSAPQVSAGRHYTHACDVWSLGIIMHTCLLGLPAMDSMYVMLSCDFKSSDWRNLAEDGQNLLDKLLKDRDAQRITPTAALSHNWIERHAVQPTQVYAGASRILLKSKLENPEVIRERGFRFNNQCTVREDLVNEATHRASFVTQGSFDDTQNSKKSDTIENHKRARTRALKQQQRQQQRRPYSTSVP